MTKCSRVCAYSQLRTTFVTDLCSLKKWCRTILSVYSDNYTSVTQKFVDSEFLKFNKNVQALKSFATVFSSLLLRACVVPMKFESVSRSTSYFFVCSTIWLRKVCLRWRVVKMKSLILSKIWLVKTRPKKYLTWRQKEPQRFKTFRCENTKIKVVFSSLYKFMQLK